MINVSQKFLPDNQDVESGNSQTSAAILHLAWQVS